MSNENTQQSNQSNSEPKGRKPSAAFLKAKETTRRAIFRSRIGARLEELRKGAAEVVALERRLFADPASIAAGLLEEEWAKLDKVRATLKEYHAQGPSIVTDEDLAAAMGGGK